MNAKFIKLASAIATEKAVRGGLAGCMRVSEGVSECVEKTKTKLIVVGSVLVVVVIECDDEKSNKPQSEKEFSNSEISQVIERQKATPFLPWIAEQSLCVCV